MEKLTGRLRTRAGLYAAAALGCVALTVPALNDVILANSPLIAVVAIVFLSLVAEGCRQV